MVIGILEFLKKKKTNLLLKYFRLGQNRIGGAPVSLT
jgi:hypothetical protein